MNIKIISIHDFSKETFVYQYSPLKVCFSDRKYLITIQTRPAQIVKIYLNEKPVFNEFLKIIGALNQLLITFCSDLLRKKTLKARNSTPTHTNF